eukprot:391329_1
MDWTILFDFKQQKNTINPEYNQMTWDWHCGVGSRLSINNVLLIESVVKQNRSNPRQNASHRCCGSDSEFLSLSMKHPPQPSAQCPSISKHPIKPESKRTVVPCGFTYIFTQPFQTFITRYADVSNVTLSDVSNWDEYKLPCNNLQSYYLRLYQKHPNSINNNLIPHAPSVTGATNNLKDF